jgi:hypothetical protein
VVTTVVPMVLKEAVRRVGSCLKVKRHFREATSHNFAVLSLEQVMARFVSGENWTADVAFMPQQHPVEPALIVP